MAYTQSFVKFVDGEERVGIEVSVHRLIELLSTLDPHLTLMVNPVTRNLLISDGRYIDLRTEEIVE